ncbi:MAG: aminoacyl-tRNA hydrolase [Desulfobacteraceae bacterium 4572_19]|nr:MAG: aminoacyl-tRNA hydrolase [Desulfobacteraceae bacterium 4572_19]
MIKNSNWLVAGLGNPGTSYDKTRHNIGFMFIDFFAENYSIQVSKEKFKTVFGRGKTRNANLILAKPMAYMNKSGNPLQQLTGYFNIIPENLLVVYDDIDLPFAKIRVREKGGHGGHNGIRSIMEALGNGEFNRLRIGVGRPNGQREVTDHVLGKFSAEEKKQLPNLLKHAEDVVSTIINHGVKEAMNVFN